VLWVQGLPDQAMREMEDNIIQALSLGHVLTLAYALAEGACPVALLAGDLAAAERFTTLLEDNTGAYALNVWHSYAACFRGELLMHRNEVAAGVAMLTRAIGTLQESGFVLFRTAFLCALAKGLAEMSETEAGLTVIDDALAQCERTGEAWCRPELLRIRGRLLLARGDAPGAAACWRRSLSDAEDQGALSWALRTATDLAGLLRVRERDAEAAAVLAPVCARFTEGFSTPDFAAATSLLGELGAR
jgi:predicted ATPase